jgi:phage terminase large subunit-like protein
MAPGALRIAPGGLLGVSGVYQPEGPLAAAYRGLGVPQEDWGLASGAVIAFAHSLVVPAGAHVNKPLRLKPFQIDFIRDVYNRQEGGKLETAQAVLSVARRNGKTLLAAVIVLVHLAGPFKKPNATLVSAATTREQASIVFRFVRDMVRVNATLGERLKVIDSTKRIIHRTDGSVYRAISAEAAGSSGSGSISWFTTSSGRRRTGRCMTR